MNQSRLYLLEASKVKNQHSTLIDGIVAAYNDQGLFNSFGQIIFVGHKTLHDNLSKQSRSNIEFVSIPVMDPQKRRLIRKSLLELWVVFRQITKINQNDVLLVTTILPSAGLLVEVSKWFFKHKRVVVMVHGEIEGAFDRNKTRLGSYGFYVKWWMRLRRFGSSLCLAVIDNFIAKAMLQKFPEASLDDQLFVIPLPLLQAPVAGSRNAGQNTRVCFIGYQTPMKGFDTFEDLAKSCDNLEFLHIGGGKETCMTSGRSKPLQSMNEYLSAIADCDFAIFPYKSSYDYSLSAAAMDAVSCGVHLVATKRGCFKALSEELGDECVTVCSDGSDEFSALLNDESWRHSKIQARSKRRNRANRSRYGREGVANGITRLMQSDAYRPQVSSQNEVQI